MNCRLADDLPVIGRTQPHPGPLPDGFAHDIQFRALIDMVSGDPYIRVTCESCEWSIGLPDPHDLPDLIRLAAQHSGTADVTQVITEALLSLLGHEIGQP